MNREISIDYLRVISCILVIIIHLTSDDFTEESFDQESFLFSNILNSLSRCAVPLFVMISGRYLIGAKPNFTEFYSKRLNKILIPFLFWTIFYSSLTFLLFTLFHNKSGFEIVINKLVLGKPFYHLWYLFMLPGLYFLTPFINYYFSQIEQNKTSYVRIGGAFLLFAMIHSFYRFYYDEELFFPLWCFDYLGYFIMGFALKNIKPINVYLLIGLFVFSSVVLIYSNYYTLRHFNHFYFIGYNSPLVIISTLSLYKIFNQVKLKSSFFSSLSSYSFGIFLVHPIFIIIFDRVPIIRDFISLKLVFVFLCSLLLTYCFSRIKILRQVI